LAAQVILKLQMPSLTLLVTADPAAPYLKALKRLPGDTRAIVSKDRQALREAAPEADVILNADLRDPRLLADTFPYANRVRWVHSLWAGTESVLSPELLESSVPLTNGRGVFRQPLGEWVVGAMLHFAFRVRHAIENQQAERWDPFDIETLNGRTLGIVGYGEIGRTIAELAHPFGMRVLALRRNPERSAGDPRLDGVFPPGKLDEMLAECDYVAVAAPLTPETRGLIGAPQIAKMKSNAVILNVGRGPIINEAELVKALQSGRIRGAALDVFDKEPVPAGHPFYKLTNVLMSPHSADHTEGWIDRAMEFFVENFERFSKDRPLENVVDKRAGY
jgi:phosphoglycerate dehydrogenase-like enzyme